MKAIAKVALFTLTLGLLVTATGCFGGEEGLPDGKTPEDVVRTALLNKTEVTKSVFDMSIDADLEGEEAGEKVSLKGTFKLSGSSNLDDKEMVVKMDLSGSMDKDSVKADLEFRANEEGVWLKIGKVEVSDEEIQAMIDLAGAEYVGAGWISLAFATADDILGEDIVTTDFDESDVLPFSELEYKGTTDVMGINSYHFHGMVDEEEFFNMMNTATPEIDKFVEAAEMEIDLYVAVEEMMLVGMDLDMTLNDPEVSGTVKVVFRVNPTKADDVTTPTEIGKVLTEEDISMLVMGLMGGGALPSMDPVDMEGDFEMTDAELDEMMADMEELEAMMEELEELDAVDMGALEELAVQ